MSGFFTQNPAGNELVAEHMNMIGQFVTERLGVNFLALVLVGSFGRGEGSIIVHDNGRIEVLNDYDFFIIHKKSADLLSRKLLAEWEFECASMTGIQWVDFSTIPEYYLPRVPISQLNFDLRWGGQVVAGRKDILDEIPKFNHEDIRLRDALDLLNTRFWCFIGTKPAIILNEAESLTQKDYFFTLQQLCKAMVACGESYLILDCQYTVKYSKKALLLSNLKTINESTLSLIEWAYSYKLGQIQLPPNGYDLPKLFKETLSIHLDTWNRIQQKVTFFKGRLFARYKSAMIQLLLNGTFGGIRGILLDKIQLRLLQQMNKTQLIAKVKCLDSFLLWLYCRKWITSYTSYAEKVADLRVKL
jgi:hypothetical protein